MNYVSRLVPLLCLAGCLSAVALNACSASGTDSGANGGTGTDSGTGTNEASTDEGGSNADGSTNDGTTTGCGTCPTGTTCGSANGIAVCRSGSGIPQFSHVFVIVMENTSKATLDASANTPYLHALAKSAATGSAYHGTSHPSLPNYLAMTSGDDLGVGCDCAPTGPACTVCSTLSFPTNCGCNQAVAVHLGDQLEAGGKTWKAYGEEMGTPCNLTSAGGYATKHIPFLYYDNMQPGDAGTRCVSHVVPYTTFAADLAGAAPSFSYITPSLTNDMHGTGLTQAASDIAAGDTWLSTNAKAILDSSAYKNGGLLVIVWDEDDGSGGFVPPKTDDPVAIYVMSPYAKTSAPNGYVSAANANHYSLLATIEDGLSLPRIGSAVGKTPLADYFPAN